MKGNTGPPRLATLLALSIFFICASFASACPPAQVGVSYYSGPPVAVGYAQPLQTFQPQINYAPQLVGGDPGLYGLPQAGLYGLPQAGYGVTYGVSTVGVPAFQTDIYGNQFRVAFVGGRRFFVPTNREFLRVGGFRGATFIGGFGHVTPSITISHGGRRTVIFAH